MADLARLTAVFTMANGKAGTTGCDLLHTTALGVPTDWTSTTLQDLVDTALAAFSSSGLANRYSDQVELDHVEAFSYDIVPNPDYDPGPPAVGLPYMREGAIGPFTSTGAAIPGVSTNAPLPPNVTLVYSLNTARYGRRGRGRMYFPQILTEPSIDGAGVVDATALSGTEQDIDDWMNAIFAADSPNLIKQVVTSLVDGAYALTTSATLKGRVDTQRRRLATET